MAKEIALIAKKQIEVNFEQSEQTSTKSSKLKTRIAQILM
jgi:hypothetical protein